MILCAEPGAGHVAAKFAGGFGGCVSSSVDALVGFRPVITLSRTSSTYGSTAALNAAV